MPPPANILTLRNAQLDTLKLPGYGISTAPTNATGFRAVGGALIEAYRAIFPNRDVVLGGHDRGARICHRLAVDNAHPPGSASQPLNLLGLVMLDIVPTLVQWRVFADSKAATAYFHWPFLASPLATDMIEAYGGDKWVHSALERIGGTSEIGSKRFRSDDAWAVYESVFTKRAAIEGSCADYAAASSDEPQMQQDDQAQGRKIAVPTLVMWSLAKLGKMHGDLKPIWSEWAQQGVALRAVGCGGDVGHYLPEEASDVVGENVIKFLESVHA